jgi:hypothetical protein
MCIYVHLCRKFWISQKSTSGKNVKTGTTVFARQINTNIPKMTKVKGKGLNRQQQYVMGDNFCSARDWDGKDYLRLIPRVVW